MSTICHQCIIVLLSKLLSIKFESSFFNINGEVLRKKLNYYLKKMMIQINFIFHNNYREDKT